MTRHSRIAFAASLVLGYMALIFYLSSRPMIPLFKLDISHIDKLYHTLAYALLGFLIARLGFLLTGSLFWAAYLGTFFGGLYGISDEFHQSFIPGRDASIGDMLADIFGSFLGASFFALFTRWTSSDRRCFGGLGPPDHPQGAHHPLTLGPGDRPPKNARHSLARSSLPTSKPPASPPSTSEPPASKHPASPPSTSEPPASKPPASLPSTSEPPASKPPASSLLLLLLPLALAGCQHSQPSSRPSPSASAHPSSAPTAPRSSGSQPPASHPSGSHLSGSQPPASHPSGSHPSGSQPSASGRPSPSTPPPSTTSTFAGVFSPYLSETAHPALLQALQDGRCDIAEDEAKKLKASALAFRAARFRIGLCWRDKGETPQAREIFTVLAKELPLLADYLTFWQAQALEKDGSEAQAIPLYLAIPKTSRMFGLARLQAAALHWKAGRSHDVLAAFQDTNLLEKQPSAWWLATLAHARLQGQAHRKAMISWLKKLLVEAPHTPEAVKAETWIKERSPAFALSPLEQVLRGAVYNRFFSYKKALEILDAVPVPPKPDKAFLCRWSYHRGFAWFRLRKYGQAIPLLRRATEACKGLKEDEPKALFFFAQAFRRIGRSAAGIAPFRRLIQRYPKHFFADDALFEIAEVFDNPTSADKARQTYQTIVDTYPQGDMVVLSLWRLAWQDYRQKRWDDAIQNFRKLAANYPSAAEAPASLYFAARSLQEKAGKLDAQGAEDGYTQILQRHPMHYYSFLAAERLAQLRQRPWAFHPAETAIAKALASSPEPHPSFLATPSKTPLPSFPWGPRPARAFKTPDFPALFLADAPFLRHPAYLKGLELFRLGLPQMAATEWQRLISCEVFPPPSPKPERWQCGVHGDPGAVTLSLLFHLVGRFSLADRTFRRRGIIEGKLPFDPKHAPIWYLAYPRPFEEPALRFSKKNRLDPALAYAIMREESTFNPFTQSWSNAYGLMQLIMPTAIQTARSALPGQVITPERLYDPAINIALGTRYLRILLRQFKETSPLAISSYNAGPAWTLRWLKRYGDLPFDEWVEMISIKQTRDYVKRVTQSYAIYRYLYGFLDQPPRSMLPFSPWWTPNSYR